MMSWFLIQLFPSRENFAETATADESAIIKAHFAYMQELTAKQIAYLVGRTEDASLGIALIRAGNSAEAQNLLDADPAIRAGIFRGTVKAYRLALHNPIPET
ncbi:MAG: hypothetical protein FD123_1214 [Bacteroidetes bacterium]|nr:MAG: hypothetical protein FD123_1214 [Bacteroidota bacterium]